MEQEIKIQSIQEQNLLEKQKFDHKITKFYGLIWELNEMIDLIRDVVQDESLIDEFLTTTSTNIIEPLLKQE